MSLPILYSFRRCPYAMRARLAMFSSGSSFILREILLKSKPAIFTDLSPKATVPILHLPDGRVLEESLDIVRYVFEQHPSPHVWDIASDEVLEFLHGFEKNFKIYLDGYKYNQDKQDKEKNFALAFEYLQFCELRLSKVAYLFSQTPSLADIAILPFLRQFANVDKERFWALPLPYLHARLEVFLNCRLFVEIMQKRLIWENGMQGALIQGDFKPDLEF